MNYVDAALYDHYNATLWKGIAEEGEAFWDDLREFRLRKRSMAKYCGP